MWRESDDFLAVAADVGVICGGRVMETLLWIIVGFAIFVWLFKD
jgi:hypothetical protein